MSRLLVLAVLLLCAIPWPVRAANTHGTATIPELNAWAGDALSPFVVSGCAPAVPGASLTFAAFACTGYVRGASGELVYLTQSAAAVGPLNAGDGTYWLAIHRDLSTAVGGWTRQAGTHYLWRQSAAHPGHPPGGLTVQQSTVSAGSIATLMDLRVLAPPRPGLQDACAYATLDAAVTAVGSTQTSMALDCPLWVEAATVTLPATLGLHVKGRGQLVSTTAKTVQFNGPFAAPDLPVFNANVSPQFAVLDQVHLQWFGTNSSAFTRAITAAQATGATQSNASVYVGAGVFSLASTVTITGGNKGISILCAPGAAVQNGSVRPISMLRWTGGTTHMFEIGNTFSTFHNCGFENFGTGTSAIRHTVQASRFRCHRCSLLNGSGSTAWSDAYFRFDAGIDYSSVTASEFIADQANQIIFKIFGEGTTFYIEDNVFAGSVNYVVVSLQDGALMDQIVLTKNSFNSSVNAQALAFDSSVINAGRLNNLTVSQNEFDITTSTTTYRALKLYSVRNAYIMANEIACGGSMAYFGTASGTASFPTAVHVGANHVRSCKPLFEFLGTSYMFAEHNEMDTNTNGITNSTTVGIIPITYAPTMNPNWNFGHPGGHTVFKVTVTDGAAMTMSTVLPSGPWGYATIGQQMSVMFCNTSGGAMGAVTFHASYYKTAGAFTTPATGFCRTITFVYDGAFLKELWRGAADVTN